MCIISGKTNVVENTNILVAPMPNRQQLTVYSNKVTMDSDGGTMILPFPNPNEQVHRDSSPLVTFYDLSRYKNLFKDLKELFPKRLGLQARGFSLTNGVYDSDEKLQVHQVGSYRASIVSNVEELQRINSDVFEIKQHVKEFIASKYPRRFGFVVCKLDKDRSYHPFGYIHPQNVLAKEQVFIPTMHYHEHDDNHTSSDWDHDIYLFDCSITNSCANEFICPDPFYACQVVDMQKLPQVMNPPRHVECHRFDNYSKNHDLVASVC